MKYAFVAERRPQFSVREMCRCLSFHPSGFYAWIKNPLSHRAREYDRRTKLLKDAWKDSGKVYGYRKLHDDLVELGDMMDNQFYIQMGPVHAAHVVDIG